MHQVFSSSSVYLKITLLNKDCVVTGLCQFQLLFWSFFCTLSGLSIYAEHHQLLMTRTFNYFSAIVRYVKDALEALTRAYIYIHDVSRDSRHTHI